MKKLMLLLTLTIVLTGCEFSDPYDEVVDDMEDVVIEEIIDLVELVTQEEFDKEVIVITNEQTFFDETEKEKIVYMEWRVKYDKYFTTNKYWAWFYCNNRSCIIIDETKYQEYMEELQND